VSFVDQFKRFSVLWFKAPAASLSHSFQASLDYSKTTQQGAGRDGNETNFLLLYVNNWSSVFSNKKIQSQQKFD
jgi:hypothetical protein